MAKRYYIAYGSNLFTKQMLERCPSSRLVGTAWIRDRRLRFRRSRSGFYLTMDREKDAAVPVAIFELTEEDERRLDAREGYPNWYKKQEITVDIEGIVSGKKQRRRAFAYLLDEDRPIGPPTIDYMARCMTGYTYFGFPLTVLAEAYDESRGVI